MSSMSFIVSYFFVLGASCRLCKGENRPTIRLYQSVLAKLIEVLELINRRALLALINRGLLGWTWLVLVHDDHWNGQ